MTETGLMAHGEQPAQLPPYCAILVVDVKDFSGRRGRDHAALTDAIPGILRQAFQRAGLAEMWSEAVFGRSTGDGYAMGLRSALLPFLINPFLPALQEEIAYRNGVDAQSQPLRMRVTIHVGPVTSTGADLLSEGSGEARVVAHRLIDAPAVRDLLSRCGPVTCVAAIVSARAYEDAVVSGYAADDPSLYVPAPVEVKSFQGTAYLRVPAPSGDLLASGFRVAGPEPDITASVPPAAEVPGSFRVGGVGDISGSNNMTITDPRGPVHTGSGAQHVGPKFSGDRVNYVDGANSGTMGNGDNPPRRRSSPR
ncbi:hypothetical protein [Kutzneria buriramensis]|uniref:Guanylate cyclase domain-containing protein n=1 Tax=Kutzneria buriramensis TaxID=1045776 RepID=A0A3E0HKN0_9PSEU|nr:hypothetical protein [Kutzneria buriramensis]REH47019.1 hypothetical protein BCF44_106183 [Kutzneria buriramensis]